MVDAIVVLLFLMNWIDVTGSAILLAVVSVSPKDHSFRQFPNYEILFFLNINLSSILANYTKHVSYALYVFTDF